MSLSFFLPCWIRARLMVVLAISGLLAPTAWAAADASGDFDAANLLYEKGRYEEAAQAYETLLTQVRTAPLLFNAGNAWFKMGRKGHAIALWLQAETLDPRNERIQINLAFARDSISGGAQPTAAWPAHLRLLTLDEWAGLALLLVWVVFGSLALGVWKPDLKPALRVPALLASLGLIFNLTLLGITVKDRNQTMVAVVISDEAVVRFGPLTESQSAFVARDGSEFRVTDAKDEWLRVVDALGREGWLLNSQVIRLRAGRVFSETMPSAGSAPLHASTT